jgi:putative aldouronate transport system substrate-binding protein
MTKKKILAFALAAVMVLTTASGCSSSKNNASSTASGSANGAKKDYVIQYLVPGGKDSKSLENDVGKEIYKKFGIQINIVGYAGDWEEKCATMLAASDYPDMMQLQGNTMVGKYINAGALLDIGSLATKYAPNFLKFNKASIPYWKLASSDGKLYKWTASTPNVQRATTPQFDMLIRSDVLEQQGWPKVMDENSYIQLLKKGLAANPKTGSKDTIGLAIGASEDWVLGCMTSLYAKGRYSENSGIQTWDAKENKLVDSVLDTTSWKAGIKFWNNLYRAGVLDPECFTDTDAVATEKLNSGSALATYYMTWEMDAVNKNLQKLGKSNLEYVDMPIMLNEQLTANDKRIMPIIDSYDYQSVVITKNAKSPERIMELLNFVCTDEGQVLLGWGIKGKHYTVDSKGLRHVTQNYLDCANGVSKDTKYNDGIGTYFYYFLGLSAGYDSNKQNYNVIYDESVGNLAMDDRLKSVYSHYNWSTVTAPWEKNSTFGYELVHSGIYDSASLTAGSAAATTETKLKEFKNKQMVPLIMAGSDAQFDSLWTKFIAGYKALNPSSVLDAYNKSYNDIKSKFDKLS